MQEDGRKRNITEGDNKLLEGYDQIPIKMNYLEQDLKVNTTEIELSQTKRFLFN